MNILKWLVAGVVAGGAVYAIGTDKLHFNGKFLGVIPESGNKFGLDDVAKGLVILGIAYGAGQVIHKMGGPASVVRPS
jgi:hypothetical protein